MCEEIFSHLTQQQQQQRSNLFDNDESPVNCFRPPKRRFFKVEAGVDPFD